MEKAILVYRIGNTFCNEVATRLGMPSIAVQNPKEVSIATLLQQYQFVFTDRTLAQAGTTNIYELGDNESARSWFHEIKDIGEKYQQQGKQPVILSLHLRDHILRDRDTNEDLVETIFRLFPGEEIRTKAQVLYAGQKESIKTALVAYLIAGFKEKVDKDIKDITERDGFSFAQLAREASLETQLRYAQKALGATLGQLEQESWRNIVVAVAMSSVTGIPVIGYDSSVFFRNERISREEFKDEEFKKAAKKGRLEDAIGDLGYQSEEVILLYDHHAEVFINESPSIEKSAICPCHLEKSVSGYMELVIAMIKKGIISKIET